MITSYNKTGSERGFTLIEILVAMAAAGIFMAAAYMVFTTLSRSMSGENTRVALQQGVRSVMNLIAMDIRETSLDSFNRRLFTIKTAQPGMMEFSADRNMNGSLEIDETFTYFLGADKTIRFKGDDGSAQPLLSNVEALQFEYFNDQGIATLNPDQIRTVEIFVAASEKYWGGSGTERREYRTLVKCRNMNNL